MASKVSVLILGYKSLKDIDECVSSLLKQDYKNFDIWFADNNSNDGSVEYVRNKFKRVKAFQFTDNAGYAGGNNKLLKMAFDDKADFCLILNPDVRVSENLLSSLVKTYKNKSKKVKVGLIQSLVMLYDDPERINSSGNNIHYLGFGYCGEYRSLNIPKKDKEIISVSGTAMLISREFYDEVGVFDESFFMYNEDQDYSWRGLLVGYKHYLSIRGRVWHKYSFVKNDKKMYFSERNRLAMIFKNYSFVTLVKIFPIFILNEVLILVYALINGWLFFKIKSYCLLFKGCNEIRDKRVIIQTSRKIKDGEFLKRFISRLSFSEINNIGIRYLVNPIYFFYKKIILG